MGHSFLHLPVGQKPLAVHEVKSNKSLTRHLIGLQIRPISAEMLNAYTLWHWRFCFHCLIRRNSHMFGQAANHKDSLSCIHFYLSRRPTLCQTQWMYPRDSTGKKAALVHWLFETGSPRVWNYRHVPPLMIQKISCFEEVGVPAKGNQSRTNE